ncbi:MAG: hypothetical protein Q4C64_00870 [Erysipelotrichia bacterium]|nr:hypothetical protein [Erysipelotrichia bacterium]
MINESINRVLNSGIEAQNSLNEALFYLEQSKDLGVMDLTGGKMLVSMAKFGSIDKANEHIDDFCRKTRKFAKELFSIRVPKNFRIEIDGFLRFTDIVLDQMISDGIVQKKIVDSLNVAKQLKPKIDELVETLKKYREGK